MSVETSPGRRPSSPWGPPALVGLRVYLTFASLAAAGSWAALALWPAVVVTALALIAALALLITWYRTDPLVAATRRMDSQRRDRRHAHALAVRRRRDVESERERASAAHSEEKGRIEAELRDLPAAQRRAEDQVRADFQQRLFDEIAREERATYTAEGRDITRRLHEQQESHVRNALQAPIESAHIEALEPALKQRLVAAGIATAADVRAHEVSLVTGFGPHQISTVLHWRDGVEAAARRAMPTTLSDLDRRQIAARYEARLQQLIATREQAERDLAARLQEIADWHASRPEALDEEGRKAEERHAVEQTLLDAKLAQAHDVEEREEESLRSFEASAAQYRSIAIWEYLGTVLLGTRTAAERARGQERATSAAIAELEAGDDLRDISADAPVRSQLDRAIGARDAAAGLLTSSPSPCAPHLAGRHLQQAAADLLAVRVALETQRALVASESPD